MVRSSSAFVAFKFSSSSCSTNVKVPCASRVSIFACVDSNSLFNDDNSDSSSEHSDFASSSLFLLSLRDIPKCSSTFLAMV